MGTRTQLPLVSCTFRYDPYGADKAIILEEEVFALPADTLHTELADKVSFTPYPSEEFLVPPAPGPKDALARVFIGQLPYGVTDMQLQWLCSTFGNGVPVYYPERIVKHTNPQQQDMSSSMSSSSASTSTISAMSSASGAKVPTGCIHCYCRPDQVDQLMDGMHKKLLIDDTGVWYASNSSELEALYSYTSIMKKDKTKRPLNRPYDTVVAQVATSTYVPKPPSYFSRRYVMPHQEGQAPQLQHQHQSPKSSPSTPPPPPPPSYMTAPPPVRVMSGARMLPPPPRY